MKNNSLKKTGFTLVEIVISISVISIISVGLYGAYVLIIKNTKLAEEKQSIALVGKRTIEDVKDSIENDKVTLVGNNIIMNDLNLLKNEDISKDKDSLTMFEQKGKFAAKLYFDSKYNLCEESDPNCVYEEELMIEKAKAAKGNEAGDGKGESEAEKDIDMDIDVNEDKTEEDVDIINQTINTIENEYSMSKEEGESNNSKINGNEISYDESEKVLILNVFIEQKDNSIETLIKDHELNIVCEPILQPLDTTEDVNHLNLHFNFKEYKKEKKEKLKDLKINVYNRVEESNKVTVNLYIEKSVDLNVFEKAKSGTINIFNRGEDKKIVKVGPLYNINVRIALKGELASKDNSKILFTGYTNKNINVKGNT